MPAIQGNFGLQMPRTASVNEYLAEAPDLAGAYARGVQMREARLSRENAEAERRFNRAMEERKRLEALQQRYGDSIVVDPESGVVDIPASERALQQRKLKEKAAYNFGYQYALGNQQTVLTPDEQAILETDQGRLGVAEAMTKRAGEQAFMDRFEAQEAARERRAINLQKERDKAAFDREEERTSRQFVRDLMSGKTRAEGPRVTRTVGGSRITGTEAEIAEAEKRQAERQAEADALTELTAEEDAIIAGILKQKQVLDEARRTKKDIDLENTDADIPTIEESWMIDTPYSVAEGALNEKLKQAKKRKAEKLKGAKPAGLGVLRNPEDVIRIGD